MKLDKTAFGSQAALGITERYKSIGLEFTLKRSEFQKFPTGTTLLYLYDLQQCVSPGPIQSIILWKLSTCNNIMVVQNVDTSQSTNCHRVSSLSAANWTLMECHPMRYPLLALSWSCCFSASASGSSVRYDDLLLWKMEIGVNLHSRKK